MNNKSKLVTKLVTVYSCENFLVEYLALVVCGIKHFSKVSHHICQNNIDQSVYDKKIFCLVFHCPECMTECMTLEVETGKLSKKSNKVSEIIDIENINDTFEHVLFEDEVTPEKGIFDSTSESDSDSLDVEESVVD